MSNYNKETYYEIILIMTNGSNEYLLDKLSSTFKDLDLNHVFRFMRDNITLLHYAVYYNRYESAKILLDCGANPNFINVESDSVTTYTPLHIAINRGSLDLIKLLVDYGADLYLNYDNKRYITPLEFSKNVDSIDIAVSTKPPKYDTETIEEYYNFVNMKKEPDN